MRWDSIIFDFDGVVAVNSQAVAFDVLADAIANFGVTLSRHDMFERYLGWRGEQILDHVERAYGIHIERSVLDPVRAKIHRRLLRDVRKDPTLTALLRLRVQRFICSVNKTHFIENLLGALEIAEYFPRTTIFGEQTDCRFKPHPDIYLACLREHGLDPVRTCAVEDSVAGVRAARAAGLHVYGLVNGLPAHLRSDYAVQLVRAGADRVIDDFQEVAQ
ncbi:HAD family phosphatase [Mycobacterium sp.]|uniref:HAD family hydrolase n=1 Tax=Mycobacterium sp. TaxID=1785 RepID=UPI000CB28607|nr:HAD family phosphatase [Mycobacterium sp.]PJE16099.1 MAG: hypothetical protein CK428_03365 [Mycobacterium sp.]